MQPQATAAQAHHRTGPASSVAAFGLAGLGAALVECAVYGPADQPAAWLSLGAFLGTFGLAVGLGWGLASSLLRRLLPGWNLTHAVARGSTTLFWAGFLWLFFLAFVPYPVFFVLGKASTTITDSGLAGRFTSSAAILATALSLGIAAIFAGGSFLFLRRFGLLTIPPAVPLLWAFAFPLPWLVVPFAVLLRDAELLAPAAAILLPALVLSLGPLIDMGLGRLPRTARVAAGIVSTLVLGLLATTAAGTTFSQKALSEAPFSSRLFERARRAADLDGDGLTALFDGLDCDEGDPAVNAMAHDVPGNGRDEDCDGADAVAAEGLILGDPRPFPFDGARHYNVLFIMVDALRADHLHFMGYHRETSPNLDRLASRSLVFTDAMAQYPSTGISVPSMLAGIYPEYMRWGKPRRSNEYRLRKENVLITDVLRRNGYTTRALVSAWIERNIKGLHDHFEKFDALYPHEEWKKWVRDSSRLSVKRAIEFFSRYDGRKPFFLFLHMEDHHEPYIDHDPPGRSFGKRKVDRYDSDIFWTDLWLGFLLTFIEQEPWFEETIIIVVADHGEEFKEHGKGYHGHQIYQESIHVPIILRVPGIDPMQVDTPVALVDLFPTLLDLTGILHPREGLQGTSLLRTAWAPAEEERPLFSMLADREKKPTYRNKVIRKGRYKLILDLGSQKEEFYDLLEDPGETVDLSGNAPLALEEMRELLKTFLQNSQPDWKLY
jgi:arylsulfatase A-like enzyme